MDMVFEGERCLPLVGLVLRAERDDGAVLEACAFAESLRSWL
jgi:hypothetical protein